MGERIFRPGIRTSEKIAANIRDGGWMAGIFYDWLITLVDDYGRHDARPFVLRTQLFPALMDLVREADVSRCLQSCEASGLVRLYEVDGKPYLELLNFRQRIRADKSKWPGPPTPSGCHDIVTTMPTRADTGSKTRAQAQGPPEAEDGDPVTAQVAKYLTDHPMLRGWNAKDAGAVREAVDRFGWDWTKGMVQKGVERHIDGIDYLRGCVRNEKERKTAELVAQEAAAKSKPVTRKFHS